MKQKIRKNEKNIFCVAKCFSYISIFAKFCAQHISAKVYGNVDFVILDAATLNDEQFVFAFSINSRFI